MNKKLGALALLGASAIVLAGCAGGRRTPAAEAETRRSASGSSAPTRPQDARDYLKTTFEDENPGSTLVDRGADLGRPRRQAAPTSLSSSDSPDVVEFGNTQAPASPRSARCSTSPTMYESLGGDDLLPGFVEAGSYDGKFYAAPLYSGARVVFADPAFVDEPLPRRSTTTSRRRRISPRPTPASRASTSPARTGTTPFRSSGRTAARSPSRTATTGTRS